MTDDPRRILARGPMLPMQVLVVGVSVGLAALDGFDVQAISFAAPGIATEWGIDRAALGIVLSMELIGMAIGSIAVGALADLVGRRRVLLGCVAVMSLGMLMAGRTHGVHELEAWRVFTGIGIGGLVAACNAVAAEFASAPRRDLCVSLMAVGYPLGALGGGAAVVLLLRHGSWRDIFAFGALVTALFIPIVYACVPESVTWLCRAQPPDALRRVNRGLARLGYPSVPALPEQTAAEARRAGFVDLFSPAFVRTTILTSLTYFLAITTFYFIVKWVPKLVVDMGYAPSTAAGVLVWANVGGATGGAVLGVLSQRFAVRSLTLALLVGSTAMLAVFGHGHTDLGRLSLVCAACGFCTNGAVVGIFAVLARAFPTELRASGTGFAIGAGRAGAVLAPIAAGFLFAAGYGLQTVAIVMGAGSLGAAACLAFVRIERTHREEPRS
jgi:benzoate transport